MCKRVFVIVALLSVVPGCRIFLPHKYDARDRCAARIPVLRELPTRPYVTVGAKTAGVGKEQNLRHEACAEKADAVVITIERGEGRGWGRRSIEPTLMGVFIQYSRDSPTHD